MQDDSTENRNWKFRGEDDSLQAKNVSQSNEVSWTASEYVAHQKNASWYFLLLIVVVAMSTGVYFIVNDVLTVITIVVVGGAFAFLASRPPRTLHYSVNSTGVKIDKKLYPHNILRSFSVQEDGALHSLQLIPLKRFMPAISLYYPPDQEESILNVLSSYLPHEDRKPDALDRLMRKVRF